MSDEFKPKVKIRPKISILPKQKVGFAFDERIQITLSWDSDTDLDLCAFFKTKDGKVGGVFSNEYRGKKTDLGDLTKFPFIKHSGDDKAPSPGGLSSEEIKIAQLEEMDEVYLCVLNYTAALEELTVTFHEHSGKLQLLSDTGDDLEIDLNASEEGVVYYIGKIKLDGGEKSLTNEGRVMDLGDAFEEIPGFNIITK